MPLWQPPRQEVRGYAPDDYGVHLIPRTGTVPLVAYYPAQAPIGPHSTSPVSPGEVLSYNIRDGSFLCKCPLRGRLALVGTSGRKAIQPGKAYASHFEGDRYGHRMMGCSP